MNECIKCRDCDKKDCAHKVTHKESMKSEMRLMYMISAFSAIMMSCALYFFYIGSKTTDSDAYACSQLLFPTAVCVAMFAVASMGFFLLSLTNNNGD